MRPVDEHAALLLAACAPLPAVDVPLLEAHGLVLAADVHSAVRLPPFTNSAMDGYAVRHGEVAAASPERPVTLPVAGDVAAGARGEVYVEEGTTVRIMTGAPMPQGVDAVVAVEQTDRGTAQVEIYEAAPAGQHLRELGSDVEVGDLVCAAGTLVDARVVALLASVEATTVSVHPRPRVVVLSTGDELVEPGSPLGYGQIVDSNGPMLEAACAEDGFVSSRVHGVVDDESSFTAELEAALAVSDAVITTGGVSAGAYDTVKAVLSRGGAVEFGPVAMQPGKPQGFGVMTAADGREVPVFTLPGNPVSALVSYEVFVAPCLRVLAGRLPSVADVVEATVTEGWRAPEGKVQFTRVVLSRSETDPERYDVRPAGGQGSYQLSSLVQANGLAVVPVEVTRVGVGDTVGVRLLVPRGEIT